jgi:hypothetical protein
MDTENIKDQYQKFKSLEIYVIDLPGRIFVARRPTVQVLSMKVRKEVLKVSLLKDNLL